MMILSGLSGKPSKCCPLRPSTRIQREQVSSFPNGSFREIIDLQYLKRNYWTGPALRCKTLQIRHTTKCAFDASSRDLANDSAAEFPRIHARDPYKRLGIRKEASEDEIQSARNFLINRNNPKIDLKKKVREVNQSRVVQAIRSRFQTPSTKFIITALIAFLVLGVLTILFPTEEGPTLQVAVSLSHFLFHTRSTEEQTPSIPLWGWSFHSLMAVGNLFGGICDPPGYKRIERL